MYVSERPAGWLRIAPARHGITVFASPVFYDRWNSVGRRRLR